jgi:hypothetical protein
MNSLTDDKLTKFSLLYLFGRCRECREQLRENLDNQFSHGFCGGNLGIDLQAIKKTSNRFEKIGQGTEVIYGTLGCLIRFNITMMRAHRLGIGAYRE